MTLRSGYSVFEVLVAFAIMALVLSALLPGQARLLARATSGDDTVLAYDLALSRLATRAVIGPWVVGETTKNHGTWRSVEQISSGETIGSATRYDLTVIILNADGREIARASTLRFLQDG